MKKNLIALAVFGAFSGAALAQSNVTLYGIIDVGYQYNDPDVSGSSSTSGIVSGHQSGSRWGIRGSEALSPNLNAVFTLEGGFGADDGTQLQGGRLFGRQVWGGLAGGWGTLVAGRIATFSSGTGSFDMFGPVDPYGTGWGDSSLGSTFNTAGAQRLDNSVMYQSPIWGGFRFGVGYSFNASGQEAAGSGNNNKVLFTGVSWGAGPFYAALTYDQLEPAPVVGTATTALISGGASDQKQLQLGATFDLKFLKIHGAYAKEENIYYTAGIGLQPDAGADADAWMLGVSVPLFGGSLLGSYQDRDGDGVNVVLGPTATPTNQFNRQRDRSVWAIGYSYPLSRRTNLYFNFSDSDEELLNTNLATGVTTDIARATVDRKQYSMGIRHLF
jgi:general bacterial porin, GBP family